MPFNFYSALAGIVSSQSWTGAAQGYTPPAPSGGGSSVPSVYARGKDGAQARMVHERYRSNDRSYQESQRDEDRSYQEGRYAEITTPESGTRLGEHSKAYMDANFPGTNPWERLGTSSPSGQVSVAQQAAAGQTEAANVNARSGLERANISGRYALAQSAIQAQAAVKVAQITSGVAGRGQLIRAGTDLAGQYSQRGIAARELDVRKPKVAAETVHTRALAKLTDAQRSRIQPEIDNLKASEKAYLARLAKDWQLAREAGHSADIRGIEAKLLNDNNFLRIYQVTRSLPATIAVIGKMAAEEKAEFPYGDRSSTVPPRPRSSPGRRKIQWWQ